MKYLLDVTIQEDVIDKDPVTIINTETQSAELNALRHTLCKQ